MRYEVNCAHIIGTNVWQTNSLCDYKQIKTHGSELKVGYVTTVSLFT